MDIIVAAPRAVEDGFYHYRFRTKPRLLDAGMRIYYVEASYVSGFNTISEISDGVAIMPANEWQWVEPIKMKGFPDWRYFEIPRTSIKIAGTWLDSRPDPAKYPRVQYVKKNGGSPYLDKPIDW